jgi:hypothetical protein
MAPLNMTTFCKHEDCPSSNELLDFQRGEISRQRKAEIRSHLETCEFCDTEVEFYTHFPLEENGNEIASAVDIPAPLYELAEALLKKKHADSSSLDALLKGKRRVIAGKV